MQELLNKVNEVLDNSIENNEEEVALQIKILKGNINTLFSEYMNNGDDGAVVVNDPQNVVDDGNKKKVLVIDDSNIIRNYLVKSINNKYSVSLATGGAEAIELLANNTYDLILLDLMMPNVDGFAVLDSLKEASNLTPVIIISGDTTKETIDRAFEYNVLDMIEKPFSDKVIMAKINRVLE